MKTYEGFLDIFKRNKIPQELNKLADHIIKIAKELYDIKFFKEKNETTILIRFEITPDQIINLLIEHFDVLVHIVYFEDTKNIFIRFNMLSNKYSEFQKFLENIISFNKFDSEHKNMQKILNRLKKHSTYYIILEDIPNIIDEISVENFKRFNTKQKYNL